MVQRYDGKGIRSLTKSENRLTIAEIVSRFIVFSGVEEGNGLCFRRIHPLLWRLSCDAFEGSEEGRFVGESCREGHFGHLDVGLVAHQILGIFDAQVVDILAEGASAVRLDAVGDIAGVGAQLYGNIVELEVAVKEEMLLAHQDVDVVHQVVGLAAFFRLW